MSNNKKFCFFIGHPRSGHSIVGALLDAHPDIVISHELHVFDLLSQGAGKKEILTKILAASFAQAQKGRREGLREYSVPGLWQGTIKHFKVIGDKKGCGTSEILMNRFELIELLKKTLEMDIRIIHVLRNPFDNLGSILRYSTPPVTRERVEYKIKKYFDRTKVNNEVLYHYPDKVFNLYHDDFVANPAYWLRQLCLFLDVESHPDFLTKCSAIVNPKTNKSRYERTWSQTEIDTILAKSHQYNFLERYTFYD